jgi:hypothetical protein
MSEHPEHAFMRQVVSPSERNPQGIWDVAFPMHPRGWLGVKTRRACRRNGGHWWHPADAMILWKCCACGADRDGMPRDGS